jgi:hypothetical protein
VAQVNCNSDKHSSIRARSVCGVTECLRVCLVRTFEKSLGSGRMPVHFYPLRTNRSVRFALSVKTVLVGSSGHSVSFNTTGGVWGLNSRS